MLYQMSAEVINAATEVRIAFYVNQNELNRFDLETKTIGSIKKVERDQKTKGVRLTKFFQKLTQEFGMVPTAEWLVKRNHLATFFVCVKFEKAKEQIKLSQTVFKLFKLHWGYLDVLNDNGIVTMHLTPYGKYEKKKDTATLVTIV